MSNHVHLLIETGAVGLSKIMQGIQSAIHSADNLAHVLARLLNETFPQSKPLDKLYVA
jgi:hypothetical protein